MNYERVSAAGLSFNPTCDIKSVGASSYITDKKGKKAILPCPPLLPRQYNFNSTYYSGMWKEDTGDSILLKLWSGSSWEWVKHKYQGYQLSPEWVKSSPTIIIKDRKITLNWTVERYTKAKGAIAKQVETNKGLRVCAVDLNLDGDIAVCTIQGEFKT